MQLSNRCLGACRDQILSEPASGTSIDRAAAANSAFLSAFSPASMEAVEVVGSELREPILVIAFCWRRKHGNAD